MDSAPVRKRRSTNFYMTDPISRASETMAECTETFVLEARLRRTGDGHRWLSFLKDVWWTGLVRRLSSSVQIICG